MFKKSPKPEFIHRKNQWLPWYQSNSKRDHIVGSSSDVWMYEIQSQCHHRWDRATPSIYRSKM